MYPNPDTSDTVLNSLDVLESDLPFPPISLKMSCQINI